METDFCYVCGANVPPIVGEGTCPDCPKVKTEENQDVQDR